MIRTPFANVRHAWESMKTARIEQKAQHRRNEVHQHRKRCTSLPVWIRPKSYQPTRFSGTRPRSTRPRSTRPRNTRPRSTRPRSTRPRNTRNYRRNTQSWKQIASALR